MALAQTSIAVQRPLPHSTSAGASDIVHDIPPEASQSVYVHAEPIDTVETRCVLLNAM